MKLLEDIAQKRDGSETILENSAVGDSQGNGFIERGVRSVEEMVRTIKLDLEDRLGERIPIQHKIIPWLVEHSVDLLNKRLLGKDGNSAYCRPKGKKYRGEMHPFAGPMMMRVSGKMQGGIMTER